MCVFKMKRYIDNYTIQNTNILFLFMQQLDSLGKQFYVAGRHLAALFQDVSNKTLKEETCFNML